jgi:hypothetical protein
VKLAGLVLVLAVSARLHVTVRAGLLPISVLLVWVEAAAALLALAGLIWLIARSWRAFPHLCAIRSHP